MISPRENRGESTEAERTQLVLRLAIRVFGDGSRAGEWLAAPNELFDGDAPLLVAKASPAGCARVCRYLGDLAPD